MKGHRWSGWPGAYCLDCGLDDPTEECLALHGDRWDMDPERNICERPTDCEHFQAAQQPCPCDSGGTNAK